MTFVPEFLRMTKEIEPIATGILVILMILFLPGGLLSLVGTPSTPDRPGTKIARLGKAIKASFGPLRKR